MNGSNSQTLCCRNELKGDEGIYMRDPSSKHIIDASLEELGGACCDAIPGKGPAYAIGGEYRFYTDLSPGVGRLGLRGWRLGVGGWCCSKAE